MPLKQIGIFLSLFFLLIFFANKTATAEWKVDVNPPVLTPNTPLTGCKARTDWIRPINVTAEDLLSGVGSFEWQLISLPGQTVVLNNTPQATYVSPYWKIDIDPATLADGTYRLQARARDLAGNINPFTTIYPEFSLASSCQGPWFKTINGDVHTNGELNAGGGP